MSRTEVVPLAHARAEKVKRNKAAEDHDRILLLVVCDGEILVQTNVKNDQKEIIAVPHGVRRLSQFV